MPDVGKGCLFVAVLLILLGWGAGSFVNWLISLVHISFG